MSEEEVVETPVEAPETPVEAETPAEATPDTPETPAAPEKAFVDTMLESMTDEEIKGHKLWENLKGKDANELGRYVKELKSFAGKKGDIPKEGASNEEWSEFYGKLGRPESAEAYDFDMNDEFKQLVGEESLPFYDQAIEQFKENAFKAGLSNEKAEELVDGYFGLVADQTKEAQKLVSDANEANETALRNEWGAEYDGMYEGVKAMLKSNGMSDEEVARMDQFGVLKEPALATALGKISAQFADDPEIGHHQTRTTSGLHDQLNDVKSQLGTYIEKGESAPKHLLQKYQDIMNKLGDNL